MYTENQPILIQPIADGDWICAWFVKQIGPDVNPLIEARKGDHRYRLLPSEVKAAPQFVQAQLVEVLLENKWQVGEYDHMTDDGLYVILVGLKKAYCPWTSVRQRLPGRLVMDDPHPFNWSTELVILDKCLEEDNWLMVLQCLTDMQVAALAKLKEKK